MVSLVFYFQLLLGGAKLLGGGNKVKFPMFGEIIPPKTNGWNLKIPTWKRKNIYSTNRSNQTLVLVGVETSGLYNSLTSRIFVDSLCKEDRRAQAAQDIRIPPTPRPTLKLPPQK